MLGTIQRAALLVSLLAHWCAAVHKGTAIDSNAEVPYAVGFLTYVDPNEPKPGYEDCLSGSDDVLGSFCGGGMISEGVFLTAAHCFEEAAEKASNGKLALADLRVGLGYRYPYRNQDGTCSSKLRGTSEGVYKVKAVFVHKMFKKIGQEYNYNNPKTGKAASGTVGLDHMDVAVVLLDECTSPVAGSAKQHYGKIAGGRFSQLAQMWRKFESKTNTEGLPGTYWGYGESEDDRVFPAYQIGGKRAPKPVRRANMNFNRGTSWPSGSAQRKMWPNCDWLPDSAKVWKMNQDSTESAYADSTQRHAGWTWHDTDANIRASDTAGTSMKASPFIACTPRNPNDPAIKSRCTDQTTKAGCTAHKAQSGCSYCSWDGADCHIDSNCAQGIGLVTYPSTGGGDSGSAVWYIENSDKLALNDRDQLNLVHIGIISAATDFFPAWDQTIRTDYLQNWLATVIDRDSCAASPTKEYFVGFDDSVTGGSSSAPPVTQSGWDLEKHYIGQVTNVTGVVGLSGLPKRANAGSWTPPLNAAIEALPSPSRPWRENDEEEWSEQLGS